MTGPVGVQTLPHLRGPALHEAIHSALRQAIVAGAFLPGER